MELLLRQATWLAEGVIGLDLADPDGADLPAWEAGAHVDLVLPSGLIRQYSLCGDVTDRTAYRIAVLLEEQGRGGSAEVHGTQLVGRRLTVHGPRNQFPLTDAAGYLFLAGGIGVTPIVAMLAAAEASGRPWRLAYGGRSRRTMAFAQEVTSRRGGTVELLPEDEAGLPDLDALIGGLPAGWEVYCCGPPGMIEAVEKRCAALPEGVLHTERFTAPAGGAAPAVQADDGSFEVELARAGAVITVPADRSVLRSVLEVVPSALYSCEEGYCGTCEVRVLAGEPDHRDTVLTDEERVDHMMICVSRSRTPRLVIDL